MELSDQIEKQSTDNDKHRDSVEWRIVQQRVLQYVWMLRIPPEKSMSYAMEAISNAKIEFPDKDPIASAMSCLRAELKRDGFLPDTDPDFSGFLVCSTLNNRNRTCHLHNSPCESGRTIRDVSQPQALYKDMPAAEMDLNPWLKPVQGIIRAFRGTPPRFMMKTVYSSILLLILLMVLIVLGV